MSINVTYCNQKLFNLSEKAIELLTDKIIQNTDNKEKILILLSGGSAVNIYKGLTQYIEKSEINSDLIAFAQGDERYRPEGSNKPISNVKCQMSNDNINACQIQKTGLWEVCIEKGIPYYIVSQAGTLEESAGEYNCTIEKLFKEYDYKIAILGIGEDGHTAGLLPGYDKLWNIEKLVAGYENDGKYRRRISLTPKAFKQVDQAIVIATGENKKSAIIRLLERKSEDLDQIPAGIIHQIPSADLFTDFTLS